MEPAAPMSPDYEEIIKSYELTNWRLTSATAQNSWEPAKRLFI